MARGSSKIYLVNTDGLKLRSEPRKDGVVLAVLPKGLRITVDPDREAPAGWVSVSDVGYVRAEFLK